MGYQYVLFGTGLPWNGKPIDRAAAQGLLKSCRRSPDMVVHRCSFALRAQRIYALVPLRHDVHGVFNLQVTFDREVSL